MSPKLRLSMLAVAMVTAFVVAGICAYHMVAPYSAVMTGTFLFAGVGLFVDIVITARYLERGEE